jgi:hypothetical protein
MVFNKRVLVGYLMVIFLASIVACQSIPKQYRGATVEPDCQILLLEDGPHEGAWQTFDLTIEYTYEKKPGILQLSGVAEVSDHYIELYDRLRSLYLTLYYLDTKTKVLESKLILIAPSINIEGKFKFKHNLEIPPETTSITFGYDGRVGAGRDGGDIFMKHPSYKAVTGLEAKCKQAKTKKLLTP